MLVILTGASGSGKTTIAQVLSVRADTKSWRVWFFDSVGVPSPEQMILEYGSGEEWQRHTTKRWIRRIVSEHLPGEHVLLEGQMRIAFIREALAENDIADYRILLVDCDDETRRERLCHDRNSPHLANETMMHWASHLRREAVRGGYEILDTSWLSVNECVDRILALAD